VQKKIGYDKFPVPSIKSEVPLFDIVTGERLTDQGNLPLVTDADEAVVQIARSNKATSVVLASNATPISVVEQFPETSETSTTLLGINRAEEQLSLFSDVSVLGFDDESWETYSFRGNIRYFPWETRGTRDFGDHYQAQMIEETEEQAIQIGGFPVPYSYPFGPNYEDQGLYNQQLYQQYKNFITLGNILFVHYDGYATDSRGRPFNENFLDYDKVRVDGDEIEFVGITEDEAFVLIDTWTRAWVDINTNQFFDPITGDRINALYINSEAIPNTVSEIPSISKPSFGSTRPGYSNSFRKFVYMQSRKAYRYQPGRISGYTFGAKASTDASSNQNVIEWGIANPTDQYVFQIRGASFSIVRRSTVPLSPEVMIAKGLDPQQDQILQSLNEPFNDTEYFTTVLPREKFNGDTLDGNGPSRYLLNPNNVTMYKIEFGWYGAIGAKFYAYIPVDNGEARWVLIHTLVIENKLGEPCLEDPYFRFKYSVDIQNTATLRQPQFVYKYGASCFIDGGDEGTVVQRTYASGERLISSDEKSLIGIYPKKEIINKDGFAKPNKKIVYPKSVSLTSSSLAKVEVVKCRACPGFGYGFNHGLSAAETGRVLNIEFVGSTSRIRIIPADPLNPTNDELFTSADIGSKIVGDGLWSGYIASLDAETSVDSGLFENAIIERIVSPRYTKTSVGYPSVVNPQAASELLTIPLGSQYPYPIRLSQYNAVAASNIPLTGSKIEIQFMNPIKRESLGHFADFVLGLTDKKPIETLEGDVEWEYGSGDVRPDLPLTDILYGEWLQSTTERDREGFEIGEANYPSNHVGEIDYRIPRVAGVTGGECSLFTVEVLERTQLIGTMVLNNPSTGEVDGQYYIVLSPNAQFDAESIINGEVGLLSGGSFVSTEVFFTSEQDSYIDEEDTIFFAQISNQLPGVNPDDQVQIAFTPLRITGTHVDKTKVLSFNPYPLYLVCKMRDNSIVNSISIKEIVGDTQVTSTPNWILNPNASKAPLTNNPAQDDLPPVNFVSNNRLDAAAADTQLGQSLRPFEILDSFFIGENESKTIDLTSVFGQDRAAITTDLLNIEATFFIAKTVDASTGTIQLSLNTAEQ